MIPARYDLTIHQGATLQRWYRLQYPDGSTADIEDAGYNVAALHVRNEYGGDLILSLTTFNGGVSITYQADADGVFWSGYIYADAATTAALEDWGEGVYDLEITDGTHTHRIIEGIARLSPEATT